MHEVSLFEQILSTNLINFIIVIYTLVFIFKKAHLGDIIQKMADDVKNNVELSAMNTKEALAEYKKIKKQVKDTPKLEENILNTAKENASNLKAKIEEKTTQKKEELNINLEKSTKRQLEKYKKLTVDEIYQASVDIAQEEIIERLDDDFQQKIINSSIEELNNLEGNLM